MAVLEKVMKMKNQGLPEDQIVTSLREEGISPKEIYEAISQSKIKSSLNTEDQKPQIQEEYPQQSMMSSEEPKSQNQQTPYETEESYVPPTENYQEYSPQYSPEYAEYQPQQSIDVETINNIAEQIVEEKIIELKKQISSFTKFKEETSMNLELIRKRLDKIEDSFNELQMAIIRKIGGYGGDIKNISKEMHETQKSFSKIIDPLTENIKRLQEISGARPSTKSPKNPPEKRNKTSKKQKDTFENYLR